MKKAFIAVAVVALIAAIALFAMYQTVCTGHPHGMC